nr:hypothetical protein [Ensifer sp. IC4062]
MRRLFWLGPILQFNVFVDRCIDDRKKPYILAVIEREDNPLQAAAPLFFHLPTDADERVHHVFASIDSGAIRLHLVSADRLIEIVALDGTRPFVTGEIGEPIHYVVAYRDVVTISGDSKFLVPQEPGHFRQIVRTEPVAAARDEQVVKGALNDIAYALEPQAGSISGRGKKDGIVIEVGLPFRRPMLEQVLSYLPDSNLEQVEDEIERKLDGSFAPTLRDDVDAQSRITPSCMPLDAADDLRAKRKVVDGFVQWIRVYVRSPSSHGHLDNQQFCKSFSYFPQREVGSLATTEPRLYLAACYKPVAFCRVDTQRLLPGSVKRLHRGSA